MELGLGGAWRWGCMELRLWRGSWGLEVELGLGVGLGGGARAAGALG